MIGNVLEHGTHLGLEGAVAGATRLHLPVVQAVGACVLVARRRT